MLEEILEANYALENTNTIMINKNKLFEILDKYQDKYKELEKENIVLKKQIMDIFEAINLPYSSWKKYKEDIEKYNIGSDK